MLTNDSRMIPLGDWKKIPALQATTSVGLLYSADIPTGDHTRIWFGVRHSLDQEVSQVGMN